MQRAYHLLLHAAKRHEVHLLALHQPRLISTAAGLAESINVLSRICASVRMFPLPAERSPVQRRLAMLRSLVTREPYDVTWLRSERMREAVCASVAEGFDLVHVDTLGLWPYVEWVTHLPLVLDHHNIESDLAMCRAERARGVRSVLLRRDAAKLRLLEAHAALRAAMNLVVSSLDAERLTAIAPLSDIMVVENGVDTAYWQPTPTAGSGLIFVGTLGWHANRDALEFLLGEIWPALLATGADSRLTLVGRDPPDIARDAAADPRIQVTGFVDDVRPFFLEANIFVCPIRVGGGTRLKVLDALAMGKALVSTRIGVAGLHLQAETHYLAAETADDFVLQILRLEADPALSARLSVAGRRCVEERFDWGIVGEHLDAAYDRAQGTADTLR